MKEGENMSNLNEICHTVRRDIVSTLVTAGCGHPGGSLSAVEIVTTLYFDKMHIDPANPRDPNRDRFVLSKGHATLMMYSVLAERGYFPVEELKTFRKNWSRLPGHPDMNKVPGIDMTTGSLGQGLAVANGMALAGRTQGKDYYCYALLGDGELQEGMVWEAAMAAAHYKLDHVIAFVDRNGLQIDGTTEQVMGLEPLADKWRSFGWHVQEIDGHDVEAISRAVDEAKSVKGKPSVIIAKTVKGKGVSFMENQCGWHGVAPNDEQYKQAMAELEAQLIH